MIFKIFVIFLITFTPINTTPCQDSPTCECSSKKSDELNIACDVENITAYTVNIKSRNNIQIVCKNWRTWEDFYIKGRLSEKRIQSLSFEKCGLSDDTTLRNVVRQLGVRDTHTLIFKSFKNLFGKLKRQHLQGFQSVKSLVLSDNGLTDISNNLLLDFPELEHIDLSNNNLNLPVDIFDTTLNLRRIVLISSGIDIIPVGIFYMLKNLESLNIISNNLEKIQEGTFDQLESLTSLNLANNLLSELQSKIFYKLMNLEKLDISMNNFSTIPQKLFYQNKKLQQLYLERNLQKMITLPDNLLANLTMLSGVQLNNNGFSFLPENLFWGSSSLQYIFLNDNSLVTLPKNFFRGLNQVRRLSLKNNKIEILPSKIFEDMEELGILDLSNNRIVRVSRKPIICNCNSGNLIEFVKLNRAYYKDLDNLTSMDLLMHQIHIENLCPSYSLVSRNFWLSAIVCKNWRTWENFYIKGRLSEKRIQSLSFKNCGLSNDTTLRNVVKQLGTTSSRIPKCEIIVLSDNGLTDISNNLLLDFPELEHIDLSNNNLNLPVDIFDTTLNLRRIVLISSGIDIIPVGIFYMLKNRVPKYYVK
ncbi:leucine-rich repeat-containing protein 15-like [Polistes fuscatus]|uniref:leucine-rich repeat-containing protein 15-like n=1 Tax=Polistes fuscatus TaxID=30207 RepID=UPI001CAA366B|nr:leucine-rich repeat-containing protein 15-like [Polistes fuscatus]